MRPTRAAERARRSSSTGIGDTRKGKDLEQHLDGESHVEENIQVEEHELLRRSGAIAGVVECEATRRR